MMRIPKTYSIGLLQAKAYRMLKLETTRRLAPYKLTPFEWSVLGIVSEYPKGIHAGKLASVLGVKRPMISQVIRSMKERSLIQEKQDTSDGRAKLLHLTKKSETLVQKLEPILRTSIGKLVKGHSVGSLVGYYKTLQRIVKNAPEDFPDKDDFDSYKA